MLNTQLVGDDLQVQIKTVAIFLIIFGAHMNILFSTKVEFSFFFNDHKGPPPQIMLTTEPRSVNKF